MLAASTDLDASDKGAPQLIVFASLSMPEQSLKKLIRDTAKAGGTVVFNGFPGNSMKAFQQGIMKVVDNEDAYGSIGIDPRLFRAFDVTAVPAIVVVKIERAHVIPPVTNSSLVCQHLLQKQKNKQK